MASAAAAPKKVGLAEQSLDTLDVSKLTPLSPEVISRQATINIGACAARARALRGCCCCRRTRSPAGAQRRSRRQRVSPAGAAAGAAAPRTSP